MLSAAREDDRDSDERCASDLGDAYRVHDRSAGGGGDRGNR